LPMRGESKRNRMQDRRGVVVGRAVTTVRMNGGESHSLIFVSTFVSEKISLMYSLKGVVSSTDC